VSPTPAEREELAAQAKLTAKQIADIDKKLDTLDAESSHGPWTRRTLELISQQPGVVSGVLQRQVRGERFEFPHLVRKLRDLGLIYSLDVGYSVSPRGRAYLRSRSG
jgi:hypothetical protein